jgi:hypothetical protein
MNPVTKVYQQRLRLLLVSALCLLLFVTLFAGRPQYTKRVAAGGNFVTYLPLIERAATPAVGGTVYYLSPTGNDNRSGLSESQEWATFNRAWEALYPGDTLVLLDGVYYQSLTPNKRNGEPGKPITVKAKNDGKVIIDGQHERIPVQLGNTWPGPIGNHFVIEGIVAQNSSHNVIHIKNGHHNVLRRVSGYNANPDTNSSVFNVSGNYNLLEDCVAAGTGRKMVYTFKGQHNVFRRCFTAWTQWDGREFCSQEWPNGRNLELYHGEYNIIENGIAFGGVPSRNVSMQVNGSSGTSIGNSVLGTMSIAAGLDWNGKVIDFGTRPPPCTKTALIDEWLHYRTGFHYENIDGAEARDNLFQDIFSWGNGGEGLTYGRGSGAAAVNRATIVGNLGLGRTEGPNPNLGPETETKYAYISNSFIEGTTYQGEGARLTHRYVNGVLTNQPLWPWPMESRIQAELGIAVTQTMTELIFGETGSEPLNMPPGDATMRDDSLYSEQALSHSADYRQNSSDSDIGESNSMRRVNVPYVGSSSGNPVNQPTIFWLGKVDHTSNYADVRTSYRDDGLRVTVHVIDRMLWYDKNPSPATLTEWDAVTLYLHTGAAGEAPGTESHWFVAQLNQWQPRPNYQAAYRGNGYAWVAATTPFETSTGWRGGGLNDDRESRGWFAQFLIPYSSLGFSGPPPAGTTWRMAVAVHDRDDAAGTPIPDTTWPEQINSNIPATWGEMAFGLPVYSPPPSIPGEQIMIRHGLNGATVVDAHVGGHTDCGKDQWPDYFAGWGAANYAGYSQINVQNQWDIADWPCFSKYFVTFPLDPIPAGETILASTLTMHKFGSAWGQLVEPSYIQVLVVAEDWDENTLTWNNAPLAVENITGTWVEPGSASHPGVAYSWNVSKAVADAYASGQPLRLALYSADGAYHSGRYFSSSDTGDWNAVARPTLTVVTAELCSSPEVDCQHTFLPFVQR